MAGTADESLFEDSSTIKSIALAQLESSGLLVKLVTIADVPMRLKPFAQRG